MELLLSFANCTKSIHIHTTDDMYSGVCVLCKYTCNNNVINAH